ncbi:hypothetical protein M9Y10_002002 [Tritrichomonas musculus]|uniref:Methyltransferase type 11 domain-containing protein n=1 Tax=Tritrichomonas musculus TaxID=1915356 RepID=A0ABR2L8J5_9EUKA
MNLSIQQLIRDRSNPSTTKTETEDDRIDQELQNILNRPAPKYNDIDYWNTRYEREPDPFDWYQTWDRLKSVVMPVIENINPKVALDLGCGNSTLPYDLLSDGFERVIGYDASQVVISQNTERYKDEPRLQWICGDVSKMDKVESSTFDVVFDKGTLDSLMSSGSSVRTVNAVLNEVLRILKPGGYFVEISYGTPNTRTSFLKNSQFGWTVLDNQEIEKITEKETYHYIYFTKKNESE